MKGRGPRRRRMAMALVVLGAVTGALSPSRSMADPCAGCAVPGPDRQGWRRGPGDLGSSGNPIPLQEVEVRAIGRPDLPPDQREIQVGVLNGLLRGPLGVPGSGPGWLGPEGAADPESNLYAAAGVAVAIAPPGAIYLEGGRVTLRDPLDALLSASDHYGYWAASAGLEIRF